MNVKKVVNELQAILSGKSSASYDAVIQTVTSQLRTSSMAEEKHRNKEEETKQLIDSLCKIT